MKRAIILSVFLCGIFWSLCAMATGPPERVTGETCSEIRLYGRGDFDITHSRRTEGSPDISADLWRGSRIGFKGRGCLHEGVTALMHLESGFGTKDGEFVLMQDKVFGRQAYLGLESDVGTVTFGRQYPVSDAVTSMVDIALPGILSPYKSQFYWQIDRLENALIYSSPVVAGLQARAGYAFGGKSGAAGSSTMTAGLLFGKGALEAGISLESWKTSAFGASSATYNFWNAAATYDLGAAVLVAGFSNDDVNMDVSSFDAAVKSRTYALGAAIHSGAGNVVILLQCVKPEKGKRLDMAALRYAHSLSRRADLYLQFNVANNAAADVYGVKSELLLGVRYRFDVRLWRN